MTRSTGTTTSRFVDNAGVKIHIIDCVPDTHADTEDDHGDLLPIVFVPGMTDVAADYVQLASTLERRVVVIDPRGHGRSDAPESGYAFDDQVGDVAAVIDDVTDGPLHLMTFSRGTCYALGWVDRNPGRARSISIGDYPAREIAITPDIHPTFSAGRWRGTPVADRVASHALLATFERSVDRSLWHVVADPDVPLLVVRGDARRPLTQADWDRYHRDVPHADLVEFTGSPHDIFRPDRTRYPALVRDHIERVDRFDDEITRRF
jgi:pimeloyl-ACP methyl ester carboxylesterase